MIRDTSATDKIRIKNKTPFSHKFIAPAIAVITVVLILTFSDVSSWLSAEQSYPKSRIRFATITKGTFEHSVSAEGKIVAMVEPTLFASSEGHISLLVNPGDTVDKDQVLARIDNPALEAQLKQAQSQLEQAKVDLNRLKLDVNLKTQESKQNLKLASIRYQAAKRKLDRYNSVDARLALSLQDYEAVQDDLLVAEAEYNSLSSTSHLLIEKLQYDVKSTELELERQEVLVQDLERQVDELTVRSGISGQVGSIYVKERDSVKAQQPLMNIVDLSIYGVELKIPESYANDLKIGMPAVITYEGKNYQGELSSVSAEVNNNNIEARAKFIESPDSHLRQNQRVSLKIILNSSADTLMVQRGPFIDSSAGRVAYRIEGDIAKATPIKIGAISVAQVEILDGLNVGDQIVISDTSIFNNASKVLLH